MSLVCKALYPIKNNNGVTTAYRLQDQLGNVMDVTSDKIKYAIKNKQVTVTNLKVTSNHKLIQEDMNIPKWFIGVADALQRLSGVKHSDIKVDGFYVATTFDKTPIKLCGLVDGTKYTFIIDARSQTQFSANSKDALSNCADIIKESVRDSVDTSKVEVFTASDIIKDRKLFADQHGFKYWHKDTAFETEIPDRSIVVILDVATDVVFINSKIKNLKVITQDEELRERFAIHGCMVDYVETDNIDLITRACVINKCKINNGTPLCDAINYIHELDVNTDYPREIQISNMMCDKVTCYGMKGQIHCDNYAFIYQLNCCLSVELTLSGSHIFTKEINLASLRAGISINNFDVDEMYRQSLKHDLTYALNYGLTYGEIYESFRNKFDSLMDYKATINNSARINFRVRTFLVNAELLPKYEHPYSAYSDIYSDYLTADLIQHKIPDTFVLKGCVGITDNTDITFKNILIPKYTKRRTKFNYRLGTLGFNLIGTSVKDFNIVIENSIKPSSKSAAYDMKLVVGQLVEISKIKPIGVYYGTQAYEVLRSSGANVNILNKDEVPSDLQNKKIKEDMLGMSVLDLIHEAVEKALKYRTDNNTYDIADSFDVEIPKEVSDYFQLSLSETENKKINTESDMLLALIKQFKPNNLPFTTKVFDIIRKDQRFSAKSVRNYTDGGFVIHTVKIVCAGNHKQDAYLVVTNGNKLVYMVYIGDCQLYVQPNSGSEYIKRAIQKVHTLDKIDFNTCIIEQSLTISTANDMDELVKSIKTLMQMCVPYLYSPKYNTIITQGEGDSKQLFKIKAKTELSTLFNVEYSIKTIKDIETLTSLETDDRLGNILKHVDDMFKESLLNNINMFNIQDNTDTIQEMEICCLVKLAKMVKDDNSVAENKIFGGTIKNILRMPNFKEITKNEYDKLSSKTEQSARMIRGMADSVTIYFNSFTSKSTRMLGELMTEINYIYKVIINNSSERYYIADSSITKILNWAKSFTRYKDNFSFEDYISVYTEAKDEFAYAEESLMNIAYAINKESRAYEYNVKVSALNDMAEPIIRSKNKEGMEYIQNITGLSREQLLSRYERKYFDKFTIIDAAKMPSSVELIALLGIDESTFKKLKRKYDILERYKEALENAKYCLEYLYSTKSRLVSNSKSLKDFGIRAHIVMCKKTGYIYLVAESSKYLIPVFRIKNYKEAMRIRKQLYNECEHIHDTDGLFQDMGWNTSKDLINTVNLQLLNVKKTGSYSGKYRSYVSYLPDNVVYENNYIDEDMSINTNEDSTIDKFNESHLYQFIQMGAMQIVERIPMQYSYINTYRLNGVGYTASEYTNGNGMYAYEFGNGTSVLSEYSLHELFD